MALVYIDSSVLVSIALGDARGAPALAVIGSRDACTSGLSAVECQAGLSVQYSAEPGGLPSAEQALNAVFSRMQIIQLTDGVLSQARTLVRRHRSGIGLRTLDAIHVASVTEVQNLLGAGTVEYVTADRRQHGAFTAEGFAGVLLT